MSRSGTNEQARTAAVEDAAVAAEERTAAKEAEAAKEAAAVEDAAVAVEDAAERPSVNLGDINTSSSETDETQDGKRLATHGLEVMERVSKEIIKDPKNIKTNIKKYRDATQAYLKEGADDDAKSAALRALEAGSEDDIISQTLFSCIKEINSETDPAIKEAKIKSFDSILEQLVKDPVTLTAALEETDGKEKESKESSSLIENFLGISSEDNDPFHDLLNEKQNELQGKISELSLKNVESVVGAGPVEKAAADTSTTVDGSSAAKAQKKEKEPKDPKDKSSITASDTIKSAVAIAAVGTIAGMGFPLLAALVVGAILYYKSTHQSKEVPSKGGNENEADSTSINAREAAREAVLKHGQALRESVGDASNNLEKAAGELQEAALVGREEVAEAAARKDAAKEAATRAAAREEVAAGAATAEEGAAAAAERTAVVAEERTAAGEEVAAERTAAGAATRSAVEEAAAAFTRSDASGLEGAAITGETEAARGGHAKALQETREAVEAGQNGRGEGR